MLDDQTYLEAISHKLSFHNYPVCLVNGDLTVCYANDSFYLLYGGEIQARKVIVKLMSSFSDSDLNILKQRRALSFFDVIETNGEKIPFMKRITTCIAPSQRAIGYEIHMLDVRIFLGSMGVMMSADFYDLSVDSEVYLNLELVKQLTPLQQAYAFFVQRGASYQEIGEIFSVSLKTVENNLTALRKKISKLLDQDIRTNQELKRALIKSSLYFIVPSVLLNPCSIPIQFDLDEWLNFIEVK